MIASIDRAHIDTKPADTRALTRSSHALNAENVSGSSRRSVSLESRRNFQNAARRSRSTAHRPHGLDHVRIVAPLEHRRGDAPADRYRAVTAIGDLPAAVQAGRFGTSASGDVARE